MVQAQPIAIFLLLSSLIWLRPFFFALSQYPHCASLRKVQCGQCESKLNQLAFFSCFSVSFDHARSSTSSRNARFALSCTVAICKLLSFLLLQSLDFLFCCDVDLLRVYHAAWLSWFQGLFCTHCHYLRLFSLFRSFRPRDHPPKRSTFLANSGCGRRLHFLPHYSRRQSIFSFGFVIINFSIFDFNQV